ncbi:MAG TPA: NADPH:quinone oxidoreductase family protein [Kofleriaceae bacterium]|nr:NADPH:quinone oxidoreductase family protein [Kofleriaceae bacterium]
MKALVCKELGPPERLVVEEVADPVAGAGEVILRAHAAGVNFPDGLMIQGKYQLKPPLPFSPGGECAGVIESVGPGVTHVRPGLRVMAFTGSGAFAERVKAPAAAVMPIPDELDFVTASAFVLVYGTSYHALVDRAALRAGETLLVLGAAGGVGLSAVEIGKAVGARVIAAASSAAKLEVCRRHGADLLLDYGDGPAALRARLKELAPDGPDVIYDPVGGAFSEAAFRSIGWRGRHLVVGFAAGDIPAIPLNLVLLKGASLVGVFWGDQARRAPGRVAGDVVALLGWLREGKVRPEVSAVYPLERGADAIAALLERRATGKLVITMAP